MSYKIKGDLRVDGDLNLNNQTANRVPVIDGNNDVISSAVTDTELGYLSGTTSAIQTQLDAKIDDSEKGAANGVATLDGAGKVPVSQLPNSVMEYLGAWDASTNSPTLADGVGNNGDVYRVSVAGTQDLGSGNITFEVGDFVIYNGSIWERSPASDAPVLSVNGQQGVVVLDTDDIAEGATNLYYTDARAQDAVGTILTDSSSIDFTYDDGTPSITAVVLPGGVDHDQLLNYVANEHVDHSSVEIATAADSGLTGGGDITATRNLSVDINGTTAIDSVQSNDELLVYDTSATGLKKASVSQLLANVPQAATGDINETSFAGANNQAVAADVTGLAFNGASVRSFSALVSATIDADTDLYESFEILGINKNGSWEIAVRSTGDDSLVSFSITAAGQIQYTSGNYTGFVSLDISFRAIVTNV